MSPVRIFAAFILFFLVGGLDSHASPQVKEMSTPELYRKYCATCHGLKGEGNTTLGKSMSPPPRRFTDPSGMMDLTRERVITSIRDGRPGTAMPAWKETISAIQIDALSDFIRERLMPSAIGKDHSVGQQIFARHCSVCHGDRGDTAVWARSGLTPAPRNFTTDEARKELTRDRMIFSVRYGRSETAMPAWNERLSKEEIQSTVDYIRFAFMFPNGEAQPAAEAHDHAMTGHQHDATPPLDPKTMFNPLPDQLEGDPVWGKEFYMVNCATCHGKDGDGHGPRAAFINPKPRNFQHSASRHKLNRPHLFEVISIGTPRSEMPAWQTVLTRQEIANIAEYVFIAFIKPGLTGELPETAAPEKAATPAEQPPGK
ncbi:MAG: c-type cytochrome [Magnetococcales bacterium]|nr:c-type cytochrome [Magnetococcales bacterium]